MVMIKYFLLSSGEYLVSILKSAEQWSKAQFGQAKLGDKRRTKRLVKIATDVEKYGGKSLLKPV